MKFQLEQDMAKRRSKEYPPIADQLDALWHAMDEGILPMVPAFYDPIRDVKARIPKAVTPVVADTPADATAATAATAV